MEQRKTFISRFSRSKIFVSPSGNVALKQLAHSDFRFILNDDLTLKKSNP